jgi:N-acylneuraminate cytidylyltransferase
MNEVITAIVPIREHSERVPRKNFRDFNGKPLYHWILETLEHVGPVDRIVVNTDADEILEGGADRFDIEVSERPDRLRNQDTTMPIIQYEVDRLDADIFMHTYCTNPLLRAETITAALETFKDADEHDSLFSVTPHHKRFYDGDLEPVNHDPYDLDRTQDLEPLYEDNANIFIYTAATLERTGHRIGENPAVYEIGEVESIDIDLADDFAMAEYFHERRRLDDETEPASRN